MGRARAAIGIAAVVVAAAILVSGGSSSDPKTPAPLPGQPPPFLGIAVAGNGRLTAAIDGYATVVDLRPDGPAGAPAIAVSSARQAAGTVPRDTGIVVRAGASPSPPQPLWRAARVRQRYLLGSNVVRTTASVGGARVEILDAVPPPGTALLRAVTVEPEGSGSVTLSIAGDGATGDCRGRWTAPRTLRIRLVCPPTQPAFQRTGEVADALRADRRWLARATPLGPGAPDWARRMYARSLLTVRALTDARTGAVAAGARDGWAYVWPRDAAAVAIALARAGYVPEARRVVRFLRALDLGAAARFRGNGEPVKDGRALPGDAEGWVHAAASAAGLAAPRPSPTAWRGRGDYGERSDDSGDYLANAIATGVPAARIRSLFGSGRRLLRRAGAPDSGLDSAVAWAVRPFAQPPLFGSVRASLRPLLANAGRYGIQPTEDWPGSEPWSAPTAWTAWSLAALGDRAQALRLIAALRRAATPAGALPERVDASSGIARSTTPLAWSHAFAALALQQLWPPR